MTAETDKPDDIERHQPTLRDMLLLDTPIDVRISPDGECVAYLVDTPHWKGNRYENLCWVRELSSSSGSPLTRQGSAEQIKWCGVRTLAVLLRGPEPDASAQITLFENLVGEGWGAR